MIHLRDYICHTLRKRYENMITYFEKPLQVNSSERIIFFQRYINQSFVTLIKVLSLSKRERLSSLKQVLVMTKDKM